MIFVIKIRSDFKFKSVQNKTISPPKKYFPTQKMPTKTAFIKDCLDGLKVIAYQNE